MHTIIPNPNGLADFDTLRVTLPHSFSIDFGGFAPWCVTAFLQRTESAQIDAVPWLKLSRDDAMENEEYGLTVTSDGIEISASSEQGVIWALTSVYHLLDESRTIPIGTVTDKPRYGYRAQSLDCARHFFPVETVKKVIEQLSLVKMNTLHWHLTDDQGWRIECQSFPLLHETSGDYYTQDEIREIVHYAHIRGVEIIPEIDLPGHTTGLLAAYPEYSCFGEKVQLAVTGGIYPIILCAGKESTFEMLDTLLTEICPLFPGKKFHIGGDEAPKTEWKKCPHCRQRMLDEGLENEEDLQGYFSMRVAKILRKLGKEPICWNDSLKARDIPENTLIQYWTAQHLPQMIEYYNKGGKFIYSEMFDLYFDYPHSMIPLKRIYNCTPMIGSTPCGESENLVGIESCLWSEHIVESSLLLQRIFPRAYALAEVAWSNERDYGDFKRRLIVLSAKAEKLGAAGTPEIWWDPQGEERRKEGVEYLSRMFCGISDTVKEGSLADGSIDPSVIINAFFSKFFEPEDIPYIAQMFKR